jgi:hypothetical protein
MNPKKLKYQSDIYVIKDVEQMDNAELSRWFGFLNFIKFTDLFCRRTGRKFDANKWNIMDVLRYVDETSGDIEHMLTNHGGIPRKYSLSTEDEEGSNLEEIAYS